MTQEEKQLLLKDLCARLPYGVICTVWFKDSEGWKNEDMELSGLFCDSPQQFFTSINGSAYSDEFKPYLRLMSSMTDKEKEEYFGNRMTSWAQNEFGESYSEAVMQYRIDFLLEHHFDYRGLIEKGLALEAPKGMYKTE